MTIPMPEGATCPRCGHPSREHNIGVCLVRTGPGARGRWGERVTHLCGCGAWQGPRPWLLEGPAWTR